MPDSLLAPLLPPAVEVVETFTDDAAEQAFPGEEDLVARVVESRRREFITGRRCAREALGRLGFAPVPIRPGPGREPRWPPGVVGSITHCAGYRAAAVARATDLAAIGVDAEPAEPLPDGVLATVTIPGEPEMLRELSGAQPEIHWDRLLFSAKESVYKAWYPLAARWLGFEEARLTIDPDAGTFTARILVDGTRTDGGAPLTSVSGRYVTARGLIATAVTVDPDR